MLDSNNQKPIIWMIDENKRELRTHSNTLKRILPSSIEVKAVEAYRTLDDYLPMLEEPRTACIFTDQRLKVTGVATYTGIELAEFLRGINSKVPIYILTNYADEDDFTRGEWTVEDIVRKSDLIDKEAHRILAARIVRRINVYEDIRNQRQERLNSLLVKSMNGELEEVERRELDILGFQKTSASLAGELVQIQQLGQIVKAHEDLINEFERLTTKNVKDNKDVI